MAEDKILKCRDCGEQFTFSVGEQEFYAQKGFENDPVRCPACRKARKSRKASTGGARFQPGQSGGSGYSADRMFFSYGDRRNRHF